MQGASQSEIRTELSTRRILAKLWRLSRSYWAYYIALSAIIMFASFIPTLWAESMRRLFNAAASGGIEQLRGAAVLLGGVFAAEVLTDLLRSFVTQKLSNRSTLDLQKSILERLLLVRFVRLLRFHTADKIQRINESAVEAQLGLNERIPVFIGQVLELTILVLYLTNISPPLVVGSLAIGLLLPFLNNLFGKIIQRCQVDKNEAQAAQDSSLHDILSGNDVVRSYQLVGHFHARWAGLVEMTRRKELRLYLWRLSSEWSGILGFWIGQIYILGMGAWLVMNQQLDIGVVAAFLISYERLVFPLGGLIGQWAVIQHTLAHARRIFELVDSHEPVSKLVPIEERSELASITLDHVRFSYPDQSEPALNGFTLHIPARKTTALVGPSGSGKSTVLKLLLGLYEPDAGEIRIGDRASDHADAPYRGRVAYISQQPHLFSGTLRENLTMGKQVSAEELREACRFARISELVESLQYGLDTWIQAQGTNLSGGERQRVSIARAYLHDPDLLLMDEPTSALDPEHERWIQQAMREFMKSRTVIVIAHRLATIRDADQIAYISEGRVVELGTHEELMQLDDRYAELVRSNVRTEEERV